LALNGASVNAQDALGQAPLHYAADAEQAAWSPPVAAWLLGRAASSALGDAAGRTPADVALRGSATDAGATRAAPQGDGGASAAAVLALGVAAVASAGGDDSDESDESDDDGTAAAAGNGGDRPTLRRQPSGGGGSSGSSDSAPTALSGVLAAVASVAAAEAVPSPWKAFIDVSSGDTYYFNPLTNATSWDLPAADGTPGATSIDTDL
jgi:hypothetical protein